MVTKKSDSKKLSAAASDSVKKLPDIVTVKKSVSAAELINTPFAEYLKKCAETMLNFLKDVNHFDGLAKTVDVCLNPIEIKTSVKEIKSVNAPRKYLLRFKFIEDKLNDNDFIYLNNLFERLAGCLLNINHFLSEISAGTLNNSTNNNNILGIEACVNLWDMYYRYKVHKESLDLHVFSELISRIGTQIGVANACGIIMKSLVNEAARRRRLQKPYDEKIRRLEIYKQLRDETQATIIRKFVDEIDNLKKPSQLNPRGRLESSTEWKKRENNHFNEQQKYDQALSREKDWLRRNKAWMDRELDPENVINKTPTCGLNVLIRFIPCAPIKSNHAANINASGTGESHGDIITVEKATPVANLMNYEFAEYLKARTESLIDAVQRFAPPADNWLHLILSDNTNLNMHNKDIANSDSLFNYMSRFKFIEDKLKGSAPVNFDNIFERLAKNFLFINLCLSEIPEKVYNKNQAPSPVDGIQSCLNLWNMYYCYKVHKETLDLKLFAELLINIEIHSAFYVAIVDFDWSSFSITSFVKEAKRYRKRQISLVEKILRWWCYILYKRKGMGVVYNKVFEMEQSKANDKDISKAEDVQEKKKKRIETIRRWFVKNKNWLDK